jgi:hypothetical protein
MPRKRAVAELHEEAQINANENGDHAYSVFFEKLTHCHSRLLAQCTMRSGKPCL